MYVIVRRIAEDLDAGRRGVGKRFCWRRVEQQSSIRRMDACRQNMRCLMTMVMDRAFAPISFED